MSKILIDVPYVEVADIGDDLKLPPIITNNKPTLLCIQGNFCGYCNMVKPTIQKLADAGVSVATVQIDGGDTDKGAYKKLQQIKAIGSQQGVPCFARFNANGDFEVIYQGDRSERSFIEFMK